MYRRRIRLNNRRKIFSSTSSSRNISNQILNLSPYSWVRADTYTVDGISGKVSSFPDKVPVNTGIRILNPSHSFSQTISGNQCAIPTLITELNNKAAGRALGAETYISTATESAWSFLQDGTGCEIINIMVPRDLTGTHVICGTTSTGVLGGLSHYFQGAAATAGIYAAAVTAVAGPSSAGTAPLNVGTYTDLAHGNAASPNFQFRLKSSLGTSGAYTAARDSTPQHTLRLWSNTPTPVYAVMDWAEQIVFSRVLTPSERSIVQSYIQNWYGIAP